MGGVKNLYLFFTLIPVDSSIQNPLGVGAIWFLPCLFEIYVLYYALRKITKNKIALLIFGVGFMLLSAFMLQHYAMGSLFYLLETFQFIILFVVGHLFREFWLKGNIPVWVGVVGFLIFMTLYITDSEILPYVLVFALNKIQSMGFIVFLIVLAKRIPKVLITRIFNFYGRNSLTVLGVHVLGLSACKVILSHFLTPGLLYYIIMFILTIAFCTICIYVFKRFCPVLVNAK